MANVHKQKWLDYLNTPVGKENHFSLEEIEVNNAQKIIARLIPKIEFLNLAVGIVKDKVPELMNASQASIQRNVDTKEVSAFSGILTEQMTHMIFNSKFPNNEVLRYDLERDNFKYSNAERDLKILNLNSEKEYTLEVRSSYSNFNSSAESYKNKPLIISYTNRIKASEKLNDFNAQYILQGVRPRTLNEVITNIMEGIIKVYFVGGLDKETALKKSYESSYGQRGTSYTLVHMTDALDMQKFMELIDKMVNK